MERNFPRGEVIRYDGGIHPLVAKLPHYWIVPKGLEENAAYRVKVLKATEDDLELQADLWQKCAQDVLFFINTFVYIIEPREGETQSGILPFNTWRHQDPIFAASQEYLGIRHQIGDKSRAQGASWGEMAATILHPFIFRPNSVLGVGTINEETADDPNSPDSLGWKMDFMLEHLPTWMRPPGLVGGKHVNRNLTKSTWRNVLNGCFFKALASTKGIGRGGRYTAFMLDESAFFLPGKDREAVANLLRTTNGLVMWSTPNTPDCDHFERLYPERPSVWLQKILDWEDNPDQVKGLYTTVGGNRQVLDPQYEYETDYPFILDGRRRSPWYDLACEEMGFNYLLIDRELGRKWTASVGRPFPEATLKLHRKYTLPPLHTGMLQHAHLEPTMYDRIKWMPGEGFKFDLWCPLDGNFNPPEDIYTVGGDIATGTGGETSSNSVLSIFNSRREQVGEFAINTMDPKQFAQFAVAVCYWFGRGMPSPFLIWERNGPGVTFSTEVIRLGYTNVFYQKASDDTRKWSKTLDVPGYHTSNHSLMLDPLLGAMIRQEVVIRSLPMLEEAGQYEYDGKKVIHPRAKSTRDKSAQNENHGDRVVAAAMCMRAMFDKPSLKERKGPLIPEMCPSNSIGGRIHQANLEMERERDFLLVR